MVDPFRAARQFERKIFRGVPEHPETNVERDRNAHVPERPTGSSLLAHHEIPSDGENSIVLGIVSYDHELQVVEFLPPELARTTESDPPFPVSAPE